MCSKVCDTAHLRVSVAAARMLSFAACCAAAPWTQAAKAAALACARHLRIVFLAALATARCRIVNTRHRCTVAQYQRSTPGTLLADVLLGSLQHQDVLCLPLMTPYLTMVLAT